MKILAVVAIILFSFDALSEKPKVVISSDFPPVDVIPGSLTYGPPEKTSDPDDIQSMVRFLLYSNEFEILGLIAASGTLANVANKQNILDVIDIYDKVDANLRKHDRAYPLPSYLRKVTMNGLSGTYARPWQEIIGEGKDSEASDYLVALLKKPQPDPIWFCFWGGTQELAQALWRMRSQLNQVQLSTILSKVRIFMIAKQDGTGQWIIDNFPDIPVILVQDSFKDFFYNAPGSDSTLGDEKWVDKNIRNNHGPLGALYPESGWFHTNKGVIEGDTPSFLYLLSGVMGLSDAEKPYHGGWGGRFKKDPTRKNLWVDADEGGKALIRWQTPRQNDFEARVDRCLKNLRKANHNPIASINADKRSDIIYRECKAGETISLSAAGSTDPDGDSLSYSWIQYKEAGSYNGDIVITDPSGLNVSAVIPADAANHEIHIILEIRDNGFPQLSSYRRIVISVEQQ